MKAIVLAGGENSRYPSPKAFLKAGDETIIERTLRVLREAVSEDVLISTNEPEMYFQFGVPLIGDTVKGSGPMGGIVSVFEATGADELFVAACDMPFIRAELVQYIIANREGSATAAVMNGKVNPLLAVYSRSLLGEMRDRLASGRLSLNGMLKDTGAALLEEKALRELDPEGESFANVNTPEDYEQLMAQVRKARP